MPFFLVMMMEIKTSEFVLGASGMKHLPPPERPEIAFVGRSNVGKSSLINMILGRRNLARTSRQPGKTRELNYYLVNESFFLVDLPGFGYAKTAKTQRQAWLELIQRYLSERESLRLLVHVVDARHEPMEIDRDIMDAMRGLPFPYLIALSKGDKLSGNARGKSIATARRTATEFSLEVPIIMTSAAKSLGRDELLDWFATATS